MEYCWVLWSTGCILREGRDNGGGYCGILQLLGGTVGYWVHIEGRTGRGGDYGILQLLGGPHGYWR